MYVEWFDGGGLDYLGASVCLFVWWVRWGWGWGWDKIGWVFRAVRGFGFRSWELVSQLSPRTRRAREVGWIEVDGVYSILLL
jgi:hypothetical protein